MTPHILHLAGDLIDIFHETYRHVDSSQHTDIEQVLLQHVEKIIPPAMRALVHLFLEMPRNFASFKHHGLSSKKVQSTTVDFSL